MDCDLLTELNAYMKQPTVIDVVASLSAEIETDYTLIDIVQNISIDYYSLDSISHAENK